MRYKKKERDKRMGRKRGQVEGRKEDVKEKEAVCGKKERRGK